MRELIERLEALEEGYGDWKVVFSGDKVRAERTGRDGFRITEMPGKPVKRRVRRLSVSPGAIGQQMRYTDEESNWILENILRDARLSSRMDFNQAKSALQKAFERAVQKSIDGPTEKINEKWFKSHRYDKFDGKQWFFDESDISFLEVEPKDYEPIEFRGKDFGGTAGWDEFTFYDDADDDEYMRHMEGMQAFSKSTSKGAARKLFKRLKADPTLVDKMSSGQFDEYLKKNKISSRYVPTVWR